MLLSFDTPWNLAKPTKKMRIAAVTIKDHVPCLKNCPPVCIKILSLLPDATPKGLYELW
jgi:hypothetical protein